MDGLRLSLNRMYRRRLEAWETVLITAATNRVVRPFEWGTEWAANWPGAAIRYDPLQVLAFQTPRR